MARNCRCYYAPLRSRIVYVVIDFSRFLNFRSCFNLSMAILYEITKIKKPPKVSAFTVKALHQNGLLTKTTVCVATAQGGIPVILLDVFNDSCIFLHGEQEDLQERYRLWFTVTY